MQPIHTIKYALVLSWFCCACNTRMPTKVADKNGDKVYRSDDDDTSMANAMAKAKSSLRQFDAAYDAADTSIYDGSLKVRFLYPGNSYEYLWLALFKHEKGIYYGIVANTPVYTQLVKENDTVAVPADSVYDWMYWKAGKLHGGYTIRALRNNMTPEERKEFDTQTPIDFAD